MFDCIGKGNNPGVYGVAVQFEKQSVHRSAEGLAFWRFGVLAFWRFGVLITQIKPSGFVPKNKLKHVKMVVLITLKA